MENKDYAKTFAEKNPKAPYLAKTLPAMGALLPEYYAIGHLSLDNYIAVVSRSGAQSADPGRLPDLHRLRSRGAEGPDGQAMGAAASTRPRSRRSPNQLEDEELKWKGYMEDMALGEAPQDLSSPGHQRT